VTFYVMQNSKYNEPFLRVSKCDVSLVLFMSGYMGSKGTTMLSATINVDFQT
jgi:hypothetical protein